VVEGLKSLWEWGELNGFGDVGLVWGTP